MHHKKIHCPYCAEIIELEVDLSVSGQSYIEDCHVCCKPIEVSYKVDRENRRLKLKARTLND